MGQGPGLEGRGLVRGLLFREPVVERARQEMGFARLVRKTRDLQQNVIGHGQEGVQLVALLGQNLA